CALGGPLGPQDGWLDGWVTLGDAVGLFCSSVTATRSTAWLMSAPSMQERKACWGARDDFWSCLEAQGEDAARCQELRLAFEARCPQQWVKYFDKRRDFLKYKKKLEAEGFHPPETAGKA
uniref:Cytochrome c oxidase assembly factor 6 n=2 Tax=Anas TaxID=8835 RepID=A0A8B9VL49_9AVES